MPRDIDRKALRDLLSDDSDSDVGIYEYPEITQHRRDDYDISPGHRIGDFANSRRHSHHQTVGEPSSGLDFSRSLFGRTVEEASLDFLDQVRPQRRRRHDGTPSLTSDDTRTGSSSSRFDSPGPQPHRRRSPSRQSWRHNNQVSDSTPHIRVYPDDANVTLPSIRELDQNINGVSTPAPPSPPGYNSRREYGQRKLSLTPRVAVPEPSSWHSGRHHGEDDQTVNSPIPRFVSPEPHVRPRYPTRDTNLRTNYPSSHSATQDNIYNDRHPSREFEQRTENLNHRFSADLHSVSRYADTQRSTRRHYANTTNDLSDSSPSLFPNRYPDQRTEYSNARNVSPDQHSSFSNNNKRTEQRRKHQLDDNRVVSPKPLIATLYNNYPYAPDSPLPLSTPRALDNWPEQINDDSISPKSPLGSFFPDLLEQEGDLDNPCGLIPPDSPSSPKAVNSQPERRNNYSLTRVLSSDPSSPLQHVGVESDHIADLPPTRLATPIPVLVRTSVPPTGTLALPTPTPLHSDAGVNQSRPQFTTPASTLVPVISNREFEHRTKSFPLPVPRPILSPVNSNRESDQRTRCSPFTPDSCVVDRNGHSESGAPCPSVSPAVGLQSSTTSINSNRVPGQQRYLPAPRVVSPEISSFPQHSQERSPNSIASLSNNLNIRDDSQTDPAENNNTLTWDFSSVDLNTAPTVEALSATLPQQSSNKRGPSPTVFERLKASKVPKAPKQPKAPKPGKTPRSGLPFAEEDEAVELTGDVNAVVKTLPTPPPATVPKSKQSKMVKKAPPTASFMCEYCASAFTRNHDKNRHIKSIHQEQTLSAIKSRTCPCCNEVLSREDAFRRHIIKMPDSCIRLAELRSMPLTPDQKSRLQKMHADGIPPKFPFDELYYMYRRG
ncbi:hypothetical protein JR316_0002386 [Psilocybe cubensis]|uniref:Uncharacterized protein n=2 Tax=Psilocybe cubensis TaxID=181762 RepID=A0ACB8HBV5_PSICU|nr:hypothetical protein JR316_0002386 [Psilocybe cubensis]KAH9485478.1 hypothetical protein JR316_0002386 [Psilocybe cubensis]